MSKSWMARYLRLGVLFCLVGTVASSGTTTTTVAATTVVMGFHNFPILTKRDVMF